MRFSRDAAYVRQYYPSFVISLMVRPSLAHVFTGNVIGRSDGMYVKLATELRCKVKIS